jgi:hypothetical protein
VALAQPGTAPDSGFAEKPHTVQTRPAGKSRTDIGLSFQISGNNLPHPIQAKALQPVNNTCVLFNRALCLFDGPKHSYWPTRTFVSLDD